jgi:ADP-ribose pyrophosphatase YjhB (NUDIX family)
MQIGTSGVVVNEYGQVLLIRRNDSGTMALPSGSLEQGELPDANVAREVRQETGLIVVPVRLVGLYYFRLRKRENLNFVFRCLRRGGQLAPSAESPEVDFFPAGALPAPMADFHRRRIIQALSHEGGPPLWVEERASWRSFLPGLKLRTIVYPRLRRQRAREGLPPYQSPPDLSVSAFVIARDRAGDILWTRRPGAGEWRLPGADCPGSEAPWRVGGHAFRKTTAVAPILTGLSGFYLDGSSNHVELAFTTAIDRVDLANPVADCAWFPAGGEPPAAEPRHRSWVADAVAPGETLFRYAEAVATGGS